MKIVYIANVRIPTEKAYGYTISKMCEQFAEQGNSVTLYVPYIKDNDPGRLFSFYGVKKNFTVRVLYALSKSREGWRPWSLARLYAQNASFAFSLLMLPIDRDAIVYVRDLYLVPIMKLRRQRVFLETHFLQSRERRLRRLFQVADGLIVTTNALKKTIEKFGVSEKKVYVAHDAVDLSRFDIKISKESARSKLGLPKNKTILLYTGNFTTMGMDKGISFVLHSLLKNRDILGSLVFVAVGGNAHDLKRYTDEAILFGVSNDVQLIGRVTLDSLALYQCAADVLIMPFPKNEHFSYYMSPLKMFEYMASGRPILTSRLPSIEEVLSERSAYFYIPGDANDFSRALMHIRENPKEANEKGAQAHALAQKYSWQNRARKIIEFIK